MKIAPYVSAGKKKGGNKSSPPFDEASESATVSQGGD
jgi:hypothetical protein